MRGINQVPSYAPLPGAIGAFSRKTGAFSVRKDATLIFRIYNRLNQVNYKLTIQPSAPYMNGTPRYGSKKT
jgi:hypothetical protein